MTSERIELRTREVGPWPMNAYVLVCPNTKESVLIDPGADPEILVEMLAGTRPVAILITHSHFDHVNELEEMRTRLAVPVMAHAGPHSEGIFLNADRHLKAGDSVKVGDYLLRVYFTPGHTDDQLCISIEHDYRMVVGDTIFEGGPGKTWTSAAFRTTMQTLEDVVLTWPDDTLCYPGHGPHFRLGDWRVAIESFLAKEHGDFYGDATWDM